MMTRKQFLRSLAGVGAGAFVLAACSDGGNPSPADARSPDGSKPPVDASPIDAPPGMACASTTSMIGMNHGHTLVVSGADVAAGVEKTYNIQGASPHAHSVVVTAAMFTMLKAGTMVSSTSSNVDGHTHSVTIRCA